MASGREGPIDDPLIEEAQPPSIHQSFYRNNTRNLSSESLDSEALLDHRNQPTIRPRRESRLSPMFAASYRSGNMPQPEPSARKRHRSHQGITSHDGSDTEHANDRTPLISGAAQHKSPEQTGYGLFRVKSNSSTVSAGSKKPRRQKAAGTPGHSFPKPDPGYDINNPPSMPGSPTLGAHYEDVMVDEANFLTRSPDSRRNLAASNKDVLIDIDGDVNRDANSAPPSPRLRPGGLQRRRSTTMNAEDDVCFPADAASEAGDFFDRTQSQGQDMGVPRRRRRERDWPQIWALDEWARVEKEERAAGERRALKISEPVMVEGRLRPRKSAWHRVAEDKQYRFTYFNEDFESTIHAETISELVQPGGDFRELFIPDPPEIVDSSESEDEDLLDTTSALQSPKSTTAVEKESGMPSLAESLKPAGSGKNSDRSKNSGTATPQNKANSTVPSKPKRFGPRPTFWLDVMCPTEQEMRVLAKTFGIHALTTEDVLLQEAREKVELFRNYYFINYRTFEQDTQSEDYLEPINMYVCVFRYGIVTFHFSPIPHPANVRRRIRQLSDYLVLSADWISYAIIDDITDVYVPLITTIEEDVDAIDDLILRAFHETNTLAGQSGDRDINEKRPEEEHAEVSGIDMLIRIGECRKKVMALYRLLGNKADVIKGFAKRCNEQWEVAPKSEIGLYLGDIQDHILTMTGNLSHYETLLSRAHGNYLAQTADILGKLTVLGTIVLPMNIVTGMFGGNFKVPGQEIDNLWWFWGTTAGLLVFGVLCFLWCKKVYKIV
ncbi:CorA metal ion transporter [Cladophialophora chaetospira]|uniref:CorA metal ion transporter n=1 Tax=Cladophialophora chaetospira TaxID=386627 RepID=A0AA38XGE2_9EURO|nr:CorA metal ion transporter [Cladophialophora chaetospira]